MIDTNSKNISNKPFIDYHIKSSHNSYINSNYQFDFIMLFYNLLNIKYDYKNNDYDKLNNHLINLLNNNFKCIELDISNDDKGNILIQHSIKIGNKYYPVTKPYYFKYVMFNFVKYLNTIKFDTPIFIYFDNNLNNNKYKNKVTLIIKKLFSKYLLNDPYINYNLESPYDSRFKNKIIFLNIDKIGSPMFINHSYSNIYNYKKNKKLSRVYVNNMLFSNNSPFVKNCNFYSINFIPNDKFYINYNNYLKYGYTLIN